jgi:hypothetical protein
LVNYITPQKTIAMGKIKLLLTLALVALTLSGTMAQAKKKKNQQSTTTQTDVEMVKAAIDKAAKAFFEIDNKTWDDCWAHTPYAYWSYADTTDVNFYDGWNAIDKGFANYFRTSKPSKAKIERNWHVVKVNESAAYARFTQKVEDDLSRDEQAVVVVLEKINNEWKIVHVGVIARQKDKQVNID